MNEKPIKDADVKACWRQVATIRRQQGDIEGWKRALRCWRLAVAASRAKAKPR